MNRRKIAGDAAKASQPGDMESAEMSVDTVTATAEESSPESHEAEQAHDPSSPIAGADNNGQNQSHLTTDDNNEESLMKKHSPRPDNGQDQVLLAAMVSMDAIKLRPEKLREVSENDPDIMALAESIEAVGQLNPVILLTDKDEAQALWLIAGYRRHAACKLLGRTEILASITTHDPDIVALRENIDREDLTPVQMAVAVMKKRGTRKNTELADELRRDKSLITKLDGIDKLPVFMKDAFRDKHKPGIDALYRLAVLYVKDKAKAMEKFRKMTTPKDMKDIATLSAEAAEKKEKQRARVIKFVRDNLDDEEMREELRQLLSEPLGLSQGDQDEFAA